jgi:repressor LexA
MYLTKRQREIFNNIKDYIKDHGYSPSLKELAETCGSMSTAGVFNHINALIKKGVVKKTPYGRRALELIENPVEPAPKNTEVPVLGIISNGVPAQTPTPLKYIKVSEHMLKGNNAYSLKVIGDFLRAEYVLDGDYLIIESGDFADNGDLALIITNDGLTSLYKIYKENERYIVRSPNQILNTSIIEANKIKILGTVVGLVRHFR